MGVKTFAIFDARGDVIVKRVYCGGRDEEEWTDRIRKSLPFGRVQSLHFAMEGSSEGLVFSSGSRLLFAVLYEAAEKLQTLAVLKEISAAVDFHFLRDADAPGESLRKSLLPLTAVIEFFFDPGGTPTCFDGQLTSSIIPPHTSTIKDRLLALPHANTVANALRATVSQTNLALFDTAADALGLQSTTPFGKGSGSGLGGGGLLNCGTRIWWRRSNCSYLHDDLLIDVTEYLHCRISREGNVISSCLSGDVTLTSRLSGLPEVRLGLDKHESLMTTGVHPCCRVKEAGLLVCTPPDGRTTILNFIATRDHTTPRPPLDFTATWSFENTSGRLVLKCIPRNTSSFSNHLSDLNGRVKADPFCLQDCTLQVPCPSGFLFIVSDSDEDVRISKNNSLVWRLKDFEAQSRREAKLIVNIEKSPQSVSKHFGRLKGYFSFRCPRWSLSGVSVSSVQVVGESHSDLFKGMRHSLVGRRIEFIW